MIGKLGTHTIPSNAYTPSFSNEATLRRLENIRRHLTPVISTSAPFPTASVAHSHSQLCINPTSGKIIDRSLEFPSSIQDKFREVTGRNLKDPSEAQILFIGDNHAEPLNDIFLEIILTYGKKGDIVLIEGFWALESLNPVLENAVEKISQKLAEENNISIEEVRAKFATNEWKPIFTKEDFSNFFYPLHHEGYLILGWDDKEAHASSGELLKKELYITHKILRFFNRYVQATSPGQELPLKNFPDDEIMNILMRTWKLITNPGKHRSYASYSYFLGFIGVQSINLVASEFFPKYTQAAKSLGWPSKGWELFNEANEIDKESDKVNSQRDQSLLETVSTIQKRHPENRIFVFGGENHLTKDEDDDEDDHRTYKRNILEKFPEAKCLLALPKIHPENQTDEKLESYFKSLKS